MESVGQKLREARLRLGLTLEQVSADTRITLKNLTDIEADELSRIRSPFFYRSFCRQFAVKVKLDYDTIATAVQEAACTLPEPLMPGQGGPKTIHVPALKPTRHWNLKWLRSVVSFCLVVAACSGIYAMWQNSDAGWRGLLTTVGSRIETSGNVSRGSTASRIHAPSTIQRPLSESPMPEFHIQLSAIERSWLSIVSDGKEIFSGMLDASQTKVLEGHESARIRTGNAGGLSFTFNGKDIGVLGPRGQIRTVVFTKHNYKVLPSAAQLALAALIQSGE